MELLSDHVGYSAMNGWTFVSSFASKAMGPFVAAKDVVLRSLDEMSWDGDYSEDILEDEDSDCQEDASILGDSDDQTFKPIHRGIKMQSINATTMVAELDISIDDDRTLESVESFLRRLQAEALINEETCGNEKDLKGNDENAVNQNNICNVATSEKSQKVSDSSCQTKKTFEDGSTQTDDISLFYTKPAQSKSALRLLEETLLKLTYADDQYSDDAMCYDDDDYDGTEIDEEFSISPCHSPRFSGFDF